MNDIEDFRLVGEEDKIAERRRAATAAWVARLNAEGFRIHGVRLKIGDVIEWGTCWGIKTGTVLECAHQVGTVEFPLDYRVKILQNHDLERGEKNPIENVIHQSTVSISCFLPLVKVNGQKPKPEFDPEEEEKRPWREV